MSVWLGISERSDNTMKPNECLICGMINPKPWGNSEPIFINCANCGRFGIYHGALTEIASLEPDFRALLSHAVRKMQEKAESPLIDAEFIRALTKNGRLPSYREQLERLLLWIGKTQKYPGRRINIRPRELKAEIGASEDGGVFYAIKAAKDHFWIAGDMLIGGNYAEVELTINGWDKFEEIRVKSEKSKIGFMAMKFGQSPLTEIFENYFKPACIQTGFALTTIIDKPPAGLIDNRLRVEIRNAKFLVADLSHRNEGAYWEAGFAEGLGKPVIYTCDIEIFEKEKTHFDTNHHHTIRWSASDPAKGAQELKDTIRATLPGEAKMTDD